MALTIAASYRVAATLTKTVGGITDSFIAEIAQATSLANGIGLDQCDQVYYARPTIAGSATLSLDLATGGGLVTIYGDAFALVKLKLIVIKSLLSLCPNIITLQRPAANGVPLFGAASGSLPVHPGGHVKWVAPGLAAVTVTAATADLIELVNTAAGSVQPEILIAGASA